MVSLRLPVFNYSEFSPSVGSTSHQRPRWRTCSFSTIPNLALRLGLGKKWFGTLMTVFVFNYSEFSPSVGSTATYWHPEHCKGFSTIPNLALRLGQCVILFCNDFKKVFNYSEFSPSVGCALPEATPGWRFAPVNPRMSTLALAAEVSTALFIS